MVCGGGAVVRKSATPSNQAKSSARARPSNPAQPGEAEQLSEVEWSQATERSQAPKRSQVYQRSRGKPGEGGRSRAKPREAGRSRAKPHEAERPNIPAKWKILFGVDRRRSVPDVFPSALRALQRPASFGIWRRLASGFARCGGALGVAQRPWAWFDSRHRSGVMGGSHPGSGPTQSQNNGLGNKGSKQKL